MASRAHSELNRIPWAGDLSHLDCPLFSIHSWLPKTGTHGSITICYWAFGNGVTKRYSISHFNRGYAVREIISILQISRVPKQYRMGSPFWRPHTERRKWPLSTSPVFTALSSQANSRKPKSSSVNEERKSFLYLFLLYSYLHLLLYLLLCLDFVDMSMTCHWQTARRVFLREISVVQVCQKNLLIFAVLVARGLFFIYFFYILIYIFFYIFFCRVILRDACVTLTFSSAIAFCRCL